jgi:hypothetical protein
MARGYSPRSSFAQPVCKKRVGLSVRKWLQSSLNEDAVQQAVIAHFNARCRPGVVLYHIPNGGKRDRVTGSKLKLLGTLPGMPDLGIIIQSVTHYLELKTERGVLSDDQKQTIARLRDAGAPVAVAFGIDMAIEQLRQWGAIQ